MYSEILRDTFSMLMVFLLEVSKLVTNDLEFGADLVNVMSTYVLTNIS